MIPDSKPMRRRDRSRRDPATLIMPPVTSLPMAGDVNGATDASIVVDVSHATTIWAIIPATDARNLTNVPAPLQLENGEGTLDGGGGLDISINTTTECVIACYSTFTTPTGPLLTINNGGGNWHIASGAGAADAGLGVRWMSSRNKP